MAGHQASAEPWLDLLPEMKEELMEPLFRGSLKRATGIMASMGFTTASQLPRLPEESTETIGPTHIKLIDASALLVKLYKASSHSHKSALLDIVAKDREFIAMSFQLDCKAFELCGKCKHSNNYCFCY